jgi:hypothetical protein
MYDSVPAINQAWLLLTRYDEGVLETSKDLEVYETWCGQQSKVDVNWIKESHIRSLN